jgi:hypothetical protein
MKRRNLIILALFLGSCTKTYECNINTVTSEPYQNELNHQIELEGTKEEVKQFESDGTHVLDFYFPEPYTITQTTTCL